MLWIQEKNEAKQVRFDKIPGESSPANRYTKFPGGNAIKKHMTTLSYAYACGNDDIALTVNVLKAAATDDLRKTAKPKPGCSSTQATKWADKNSSGEVDSALPIASASHHTSVVCELLASSRVEKPKPTDDDMQAVPTKRAHAANGSG